MGGLRSRSELSPAAVLQRYRASQQYRWWFWNHLRRGRRLDGAEVGLPMSKLASGKWCGRLSPLPPEKVVASDVAVVVEVAGYFGSGEIDVVKSRIHYSWCVATPIHIRVEPKHASAVGGI